MSAVTKLDITNSIIDGAIALGNSKKGLKELCSDILNSTNTTNKSWAELTHLSPVTIDRMRKLTEAESGADYRPAGDTMERIFLASGVEFTAKQVRIKPSRLPKEKG